MISVPHPYIHLIIASIDRTRRPSPRVVRAPVSLLDPGVAGRGTLQPELVVDRIAISIGRARSPGDRCARILRAGNVRRQGVCNRRLVCGRFIIWQRYKSRTCRYWCKFLTYFFCFSYSVIHYPVVAPSPSSDVFRVPDPDVDLVVAWLVRRPIPLVAVVPVLL